MFQRSPLPTRQGELPVTSPFVHNLGTTETLQIPQICVPPSPNTNNPICIQPSQSLEVNYQAKAKTNLDPHFLIVCISLLLLLLALVGFVGYWLITKTNKHHNNSNDKQAKRRERFLTMFLCGYGILTAIVILLLFYLIVCQ